MTQTYTQIQDIKHAVRERDGMRCTECGITAEEHIALTGKTLDVHRLTPGSPYSLEGTVTLCRSCHGPKPRSPRGSCPSKPRRMAGVREVLAAKLDVVARRNATDFTEEVNRAVRELLVREGLWPPADETDD